jgi:hypothetical protein
MSLATTLPGSASEQPAGTYKGHLFVSVATQIGGGSYRATVAMMALDGTRTRSQRFLDFGTFGTKAEADETAMAAAKAWIDDNSESDSLALPTISLQF